MSFTSLGKVEGLNYQTYEFILVAMRGVEISHSLTKARNIRVSKRVRAQGLVFSRARNWAAPTISKSFSQQASEKGKIAGEVASS